MCSEFRPASPVVILASLFHKVCKKTREVEQRQSRVQSMLRWVTYDIWEARVSLTIPETLAENQDEFGKIWKIYGGWAKFSNFQPLEEKVPKRSGTEDKEADSSTYKMQVNNEPAKTKTKPKPRSPKETESVQWAWCRHRCQSQWRWPPKMWHLSHVVILRRLHIKWVSSRTILSPRRPILWARSLSKPYIKRFRKK